MECTSFYRDTWVEVDLDCIEENVKSMISHLSKEQIVIAVVKANGYGHGDVQVARTALNAGASYLAVAFLDEALSLRRHGIQAPIIVLGASRSEDVNVAAENNVTLTVFNLEWIIQAKERLDKDKTVSFHLKLDTGMGRLGIKDEGEMLEVIKVIDESPMFHLEGIFTHFATADELDLSYFHAQFERFNQFLSLLPYQPKLIHTGNSATGLRFPEKTFNAVRLGIAMYGLTPSTEMKGLLPYELKEAFSLHSKLVHVKKLTEGEKVSYGATYTANEEEWVGTVPIGYADGWIRKHQGAEVLVEGNRCEIIGRVCMDQFVVRLPHQLPVGSRVTLIGTQGNQTIGIDEVAKRLETINYEIPCTINFRVPRIFLEKQSIIEVRNTILL
ncbi:alanine racemase [Litchfieldia salsa]|uniref:Alanine racemase n=1 Tax=Litchfieldia salsa TaxID=930152 RepID=A0A1H0WXK3_9BACI|nr:alanine racemase [Litchfieldia salsa]SDP95441.1 alanine racemase [Litchfieldia salsa]